MHGITITETNETTRSLITVATGVIGMVVTAPDADAAVFPLDRPALIVDIDAAIGAAGTTGTLSRSLRAIADQVRCPVVVVRVAPGVDANATNAAVIGTTTNGLKTGMQALLAAEGQVGVRPRILGAPGLDTLPVRAALQVIAQRLRAMVYAKAIGDDTASAIADRANASGRDPMGVVDLMGWHALAIERAKMRSIVAARDARADRGGQDVADRLAQKPAGSRRHHRPRRRRRARSP